MDEHGDLQEIQPQGQRKFFIQMSGAPGSGKSTLANQLRQPLGAVVIDHDIVKSTLLADDNVSFNQAAKLAYNLGWALAGSMMRQEFSVIMDSVCNYEETLAQGLKLARLYGFEYWYIECQAGDMDLLDERLRKRTPLRSQRTSVDRPPVDAVASQAEGEEDSRALFRRFIDNPCRLGEDERVGIVVVDSTESSEERRDYILERMSLDTDQRQHTAMPGSKDERCH
ncbi:hypothetical protein CHGG_04824 [Chaetomium globosum CBS 148.51]|uniref:Zeta toxin domain-containing protein n=1 Tax=Chaetomium globosum (strain ATCC 6205 / CBS 148.51 / DSM 1962 / NBRC 6347 / NRRL 1970) TaxID=306901 RepID=Q2H072_CHAGB|nr:uncharacterized protein CHGG_04824 [Chaetomium globosum CBS 148.51]EAQ88205.1 hypothetical protein CHGG_04824 [Chaetomium globosum CBS 148.51]